MPVPLYDLLILLLKSVVVLGLAGGLVLLLRRQSAAWRHAVWTLGLAGVLALPFAAVLVPAVSLPWLGVDFAPTEQRVDRTPADVVAEGEAESHDLALTPDSEHRSPSLGEASGEASRTVLGSVRPPDAAGKPRWMSWLPWFWAAGTALMLAGLIVGFAGVWWIERGIIGPDLKVRNGEVVTDAGERSSQDSSIRGYKKMLNEDPDHALALADLVIKNTYKTLLTRGMKGCYVYCTDRETADYLRSRLCLISQPE